MRWSDGERRKPEDEATLNWKARQIAEAIREHQEAEVRRLNLTNWWLLKHITNKGHHAAHA